MGEAGVHYSGAGKGVTNRVPSVPFGTICHSEVTNRIGGTNRFGKTSNLIRFITHE